MSIWVTIRLSKSGHQKLPAELDPTAESLVYGQGLPYASDDLDALASEAGVRPISEFFDDSAMLSDEEYEQEGLQKPPQKWFAVADGLRTVDALIASLEHRDEPGALGHGIRRSSVDAILWDLRASRLILGKAAATDEQFQYDVG